LILKGIDTFEFGLEICNYRNSLESYLAKFKELKEKAQSSGIESTIRIGDLELTVHKSGQKFYTYRLSCKDFLIAFMENDSLKNAPIFGDFYLHIYGHMDLRGRTLIF
jgi:hypothetical protein